ncbi:MAG: hypothetical protein JNK12_11210 [Acidimicrobiales bacterium]|nr:hypothetical protein [Acidimicrobiales bacterium]
MSTMHRDWTQDSTRTDALLDRPSDTPTKTTQDELADRAGHLRGVTRYLLEDVAEVHDEAMAIQLDARTDEAAKRSVQDLLSELAGLGFAWRDIARLVDVTVPAVRKWRHGESTTGAHRRSVARLLAFVDVLRCDHLVSDVASWMEIPLAGSEITAIDIYSEGDATGLLEYAAGHITSEDLLDASFPQWRVLPDDHLEVAMGDDGEPVIRLQVETRE